MQEGYYFYQPLPYLFSRVSVFLTKKKIMIKFAWINYT